MCELVWRYTGHDAELGHKIKVSCGDVAVMAMCEVVWGRGHRGETTACILWTQMLRQVYVLVWNTCKHVCV